MNSSDITQSLQRVVVVGTSGCGKTFFAQRLAERLQLRHIELDRLFWLPGWHPKDPTAFRGQVEQRLAGSRWVVDGNYGSLRDLIWPRASHVIWLNYAYTFVVWQVTRRTIANIVRQREVFPGCRETLVNAFLSQKSVIWWAITTYHRRRLKYQELFNGQAFPHLTWIEMRNLREANRFLASLKFAA